MQHDIDVIQVVSDKAMDEQAQASLSNDNNNNNVLDQSVGSEGKDPVPEESPLANGMLQITKQNMNGRNGLDFIFSFGSVCQS